MFVVDVVVVNDDGGGVVNSDMALISLKETVRLHNLFETHIRVNY